MVLLRTNMDQDFEVAEGFEWDESNLGHIQKHNVSAEECEEVFNNEPIYFQEDVLRSQVEQRYEIIGQTNGGRNIFLVFTIRDGKVRILSARDQSRKERRDYEKTQKNSDS